MDCIVNCILLFVVTFVVFIVTVPATSVATPIVAFVPSLIYSPSPAVISFKSLKCVFPVATSIALKSAAAVIVGLTYRPLVIPFAPPVWFIVGLILKSVHVAVPDVGANVAISCARYIVPVVFV